ncbi:uncharacterized protein LOC128204534 [Mya arenaria]|uniref:uncharacterized protein LOC128204534 n=1 Tax=Mya arenaria TaxID=6604 RepID=UPI0022E1D7CC|nr:uncharacterized protein LOC128204534 [Mya arenaria]
MAASSAASYFKVKTILNKTETSTIQAINLNQSLSEFASAYLADKDVHIERAAGDDADTDLNTPFWVIISIVAKVRGFALCRECGKRRVVYSAKKLSTDEERSVMRAQEELVYMCGNPLFHAGIYHNTIIVKEGINCNSMMEAAYYAGKTVQFDNVCFHCGDTEVADNEGIKQLKEEFGIVRPICESENDRLL